MKNKKLEKYVIIKYFSNFFCFKSKVHIFIFMNVTKYTKIVI